MIHIGDLDDSEWTESEKADFYRDRWNKMTVRFHAARNTIRFQRWVIGILVVAFALALTQGP